MMSQRSRCIPVLLLTLVSLGACYRYTPVVAPMPGQDVSLVLSDRGRVAVAEQAGPNLDQLRGTVLRRSDSTLTIAMRSALSIRGGVTPWVGESLTVASALLSSVQARRLSRPRTVLLSTLVTSAVVTFIATNGFGVDGRRTDTEPGTPPRGPGPASVRLPMLPSLRSH